MNYVWDFAILGKYSHLFWLGLGWTIAYTIGTVVLGTVLGLVVGILRLRRWPVIDWLLLAYIALFRCSPMLAPYASPSATQLKNTSLVSIIAVPALVYNATLINAETYRPLEVYTIVALIYFVILFPATLVARRLERGLTYDKA